MCASLSGNCTQAHGGMARLLSECDHTKHAPLVQGDVCVAGVMLRAYDVRLKQFVSRLLALLIAALSAERFTYQARKSGLGCNDHSQPPMFPANANQWPGKTRGCHVI